MADPLDMAKEARALTGKPDATVKREGTLVIVDGAPSLWLESPIATRPQDWAPAARAILFPTH